MTFVIIVSSVTWEIDELEKQPHASLRCAGEYNTIFGTRNSSLAPAPQGLGVKAVHWKAKLAMGQNLRYLFWDDYPPKIVYFKGFWDVHRGPPGF